MDVWIVAFCEGEEAKGFTRRLGMQRTHACMFARFTRKMHGKDTGQERALLGRTDAWASKTDMECASHACALMVTKLKHGFSTPKDCWQAKNVCFGGKAPPRKDKRGGCCSRYVSLALQIDQYQ